MKISLVNIQSFKEALYDLPDTGLVQILGDNSNGKSVVGKVLKFIAAGEIKVEKERASLIRDTEQYGFVTIEYKNKFLIFRIDRELSGCIVQLKRENGEVIRRTVREGGIQELVYEFGFRVYNAGAVALQVYETLGIIPFVNTTAAANYEMVETITTDSTANRFVKNYREITSKEFSKEVKNYKTILEEIQSMQKSLHVYDVEAYKKMRDKLVEMYAVLEHLTGVEISKIKIPPNVKILDIPVLNLKKLPVVKVIFHMENLPDMTETIKALNEVKQGRCPTCGRLFLEKECIE